MMMFVLARSTFLVLVVDVCLVTFLGEILSVFCDVLGREYVEYIQPLHFQHQKIEPLRRNVYRAESLVSTRQLHSMQVAEVDGIEA